MIIVVVDPTRVGVPPGPGRASGPVGLLVGAVELQIDGGRGRRILLWFDSFCLYFKHK